MFWIMFCLCTLNTNECVLLPSLQEELADRPRMSTIISQLANYNATIPTAEDPDAKPKVCRGLWPRTRGFALG